MNHLDNTTLNLYLDDALDPTARANADGHLASCAACAGELAALRALTASFDTWHAEPIPHDLSVQVMQRVAQRPAPDIGRRWGAILLGAQVLVAAALVVWLLPTLSRILSNSTNIPLPSFSFDPYPDLAVWSETLAVALPSFGAWAWGLLLVGGAAVWLVANRLIFKSLNHTTEASQ